MWVWMGQYFMATVTPRMRQYLNDTHKKRAARAREKETRTETQAKLAPRGWLYLQNLHDEYREHLWQTMNEDERAVIGLMCETGMSMDRLHVVVNALFEKVEVPF